MEKQEYVQASIDNLFATWMRRTAAFGAFIFLLLSLLDYVAFRAHFLRFLGYRIAVAAFLLQIAVLAGKTRNRIALRSFGFAAVAASAVAIEAMILNTGGHNSSYATGMILLAVVALAFLPAEFPFHVTTASVIYGVYFLPIIWAERIDDRLSFFTANFFMCSIILTVLVFRHLSMQSLGKQLGTEFELICSGNRLRENEARLEAMAAKRTEELAKTIAQLEAEVNERKRVEGALERNRKLLHDVFEGIQDGITVLDTEQNIVMANSAAERFFGCNDPIGFTQERCFELSRRVTKQYENYASDGTMEEKTARVETVAYKLEGREAGSLEVFTFPFCGEQGEIKGVILCLRDVSERKRAEAERDQYFKFSNFASDLLCIASPEGYFKKINPAFSQALGYSEQELLEKPLLELIHPDDRRSTQEEIATIIQGGTAFDYENRCVCADGSLRWLSWRATFEESEGIIYAAARDITEHKAVEEKLRASENRFRTLFEKASEGIFLLSVKTEILAVNEAYARMHGYSVEEMLNISLWDLDVNLDPQTQAARMNRIIAEGSIMLEVEHRHKAGHTFPLEVSATFIELNDEKYFLCFHRDISERKKTSKELQEKEAKMRAMLDSFDGFIYICSPDYRIEFMNENLVRRIGRNAVGEPCYAVLNDRVSSCPWCANERVFRGETVRYEAQSPKDGLWYFIVNTPIRHADGSLSKQAMFLDITDKKRAELALKENEERYRRLLASVTDYIYTVRVEDGRPVATEHGEGCVAVTGYLPEQFQTDPDLWYRMVYTKDRDPVLEMARRMLSGEKADPLEHRIVHRNGSVRWVRNTPARRFDKLGQIMAFDGLISDITERKRLEEELEKTRAQEEENLKVFSRLLIKVQEEERRDIARELHDEIGQSLTGLKLSVESFACALPAVHADNMKAIEASLGEMLGVVRNMSLNLRPSMLDDFGLISTLQWYFERYEAQTGISVNFRQTGTDRRFEQQKEIALYRITQEALTNVARHAGVKSVHVKLIIKPDTTALRIHDTGRGFEIEDRAYSGSGLSIIRERTLIENGEFFLRSTPGVGTRIDVTIPLQIRSDGRGDNI